MLIEQEPVTTPWPLTVNLKSLNDSHTNFPVNVHAGINALVGPNGSGKTRALRDIKLALESSGRIQGRKVHLLVAGRSSPLESFRAAVDRPGQKNNADATVGHTDFRRNWWQYESITGALLTLDSRADLRLKIEARLQQLFDRSVKLSWSQGGLHIQIVPANGGAPYAANDEASGIMHLVALLATIHNDEIGALLIDEPEVSLHPQHQAFILEEMELVAGDPLDPARKIIVIATHSSSSLPLRSIGDLPSLIFFNSIRSPPAQISADADILKRKKMRAFISRLSATHRTAMFAERVLLVEGPSDEIVAAQLARRLDLRLLARNSQILPVMGKGEFIDTAKLFRLMGKEVTVLGDLDALADDNTLVRSFSELPSSLAVANQLGQSSIMDLDRGLRVDLEKFIMQHADSVRAAADQYYNWSSTATTEVAQRRMTLACILNKPTTFDETAAIIAKSLQTRYMALVDALAKLGCFFLRRGAIENYFSLDVTDRDKTEIAAQEAATFETTDPDTLRERYLDLFSALGYVAPNQRIDEDHLLRPKLGAILASTFLSMKIGSSDQELNSIASMTIGDDASVFRLSNRSNDKLRIAVDIASPLFHRDGFPFEISCDENPNHVPKKVLPGLDNR